MYTELSCCALLHKVLTALAFMHAQVCGVRCKMHVCTSRVTFHGISAGRVPQGYQTRKHFVYWGRGGLRGRGAGGGDVGISRASHHRLWTGGKAWAVCTKKTNCSCFANYGASWYHIASPSRCCRCMFPITGSCSPYNGPATPPSLSTTRHAK